MLHKSVSHVKSNLHWKVILMCISIYDRTQIRVDHFGGINLLKLLCHMNYNT